MVTVNGIPVCERGFYINLAHRTERRKFMEEQLRKRGIEGVERFEAHYHDEATGATSREGSRKSHLAVMRKILDEGVESCLLLEDDVEILDSFNSENLREAAEFEEADLIWLGGLPHALFRHGDRFTLSISKANAFASIVRPSFARIAVELGETGDLGQGSADSLYVACSFGSKDRLTLVRRIFEDERADKTAIPDLLSAKQYLFREPLVCHWDDAVSDNEVGEVLNRERMSCGHFVKSYLERVSRAQRLEDLNGTAVLINYNLREAPRG
jgi:hypothetical protein